MGGWSGAEASKISQALCNDPLLHDTQMPNVVMREMIKGSVQVGTGSTKQVSAGYKGYWGYSSIYIMVAAAKSLQSCPTLCDPIDGSPPGSPSLGFSRQEHWSGLPFPSPMKESESEVTQPYPTLSNPVDCSLPGSSIYGIFQARVLVWGAIAFSDIMVSLV